MKLRFLSRRFLNHRTQMSSSKSLSRRSMLKMTGAAAFLTPGFVSHLGVFQRPPKIIWDKKRVCVRIGNVEWKVDRQWFDGQPKLTCAHTETETKITLTNALFPGTSFPADFECIIENTGTQWRITFGFLFGASFSGNLHHWFYGQSLEGESKIQRTYELGNVGTIAFDSGYPIQFRKEWTFRFHSDSKHIRFKNHQLDIRASTLFMELFPQEFAGMQQPPKRRVSWVLQNLDTTHCEFALPSKSGWQLEQFPFHRITIVTGRTVRGKKRGAICAESQEEKITLLSRDLPIHFFVESPAALLYVDDAYSEFLFSAPFSQRNLSWIHTQHASMEVGGDHDIPPFEIVEQNGKPIQVRCEPRVHRLSIALADALTEPTVPLFPTALSLEAVNARSPHSLRQEQVPSKVQKSKIHITKLGQNIDTLLGNTVSFTVLRPEDLLYLRFDFVHAQLRESRIQVSPETRMIVTFPPQSIAERAYYESESPATSEQPEKPPVPARISGESRLVFRFPAGITELPLRLDALLRWEKLEPVLTKNALPPTLAQATAVAVNILSTATTLFTDERLWRRMLPVESEQRRQQPLRRITPMQVTQLRQQIRTSQVRFLPKEADQAIQHSVGIVQELTIPKPSIPPKPEAPSLTETAIELPYRLFISPHRHAAWAHRTELPAEKNITIELWHTRLGVRAKDGSVDEGNTPLRTIRAIWSWDLTSPPPDPNDLWPFRASLTRNDRYQIVHLSSNFTIANYTPDPIAVQRLMLTALGGWLNSKGLWDPPTGFSVEEWSHQATLGRDHFVRVVYAGFLWPFGHRASLVKITERKFRRTPNGDMAAYLFQKQFIIIREPVKTFPASGLPGQRYGGRKFPFRKVELKNLVTPALDDPSTTGIAGLGNQAFWPRVGGKDFLFRCVATDWEGHDAEFTLPLIFLQNPVNQNNSQLIAIRDAYHSTESWRTIQLSGQIVAFAPPAQAGDTSFEAASMLLNVFIPDPATSMDRTKFPFFYPEMERADIRVEEVEALLGAGATTSVQLYGDDATQKGFLPGGFDPSKNAGEVFLELLNPISLNFSQNTDKAGGLASPNVKIQAISRGVGPVGANSPFDDFVNGKFDPGKFFDQVMEAKIVGSIKLKHILQVLTFAAMAASEAKKIPKLVQKTVYDFVEDIRDLKQDIEDRYEATINAIEALPGAVSAAVQTAVTELKGALQDVKTTAQNIKNTFETEINNLIGDFSIRALLDFPYDISDPVQKQIKQAVEQLQERLDRAEEKFNTLRSLIEQEIKANKELAKEIRQKYDKWKKFIDDLRKGITLEYKWETDKIDSWPSGNPLFEAYHTTDRQTKLLLKTSAKQPLKPVLPEVHIKGELQQFTVHLIAGIMVFLSLDFKRITLTSKNFSKTKVDVDLAGIEFKGPLSFVSKLQDLIPKGGFGDYLPKIDLTKNPVGLLVTFKLGLPSISVGVLSIQNIALHFSLKVPFVSDPVTLRFGFCERHDPFRLTVYVFGGGGFFALELTPAGVSLLEAAFEFGGCFAFSVAVAQGSCGAMVGIYYRMVSQSGGSVATLEGYFRMWGELRVLGIVSISATLYMSLTWQSNGKVYGQATLAIEISVLFFSFSASVKVERQFKGSSGDPPFHQMYPTPEPWQKYCLAFA